jgi:hypothetical protein
VAGDPIARAAELAETARQRARREREIASMQGPQSYWREVFEHAADTHSRAADLHAKAVGNLLWLRALREEMLDSRCRLAEYARVEESARRISLDVPG